ncbi:MAG: hypothetical protein RLZZ175_1096 [Bacteroidota bacterium]|jgi:UDPglucose--hexose-1-phosphate uridylyltransferase
MSQIREKRWHPLLQEWVIIAESTASRPWNGAVSKIEENDTNNYDSNCYLCPTNTRANGKVNADYTFPFSFENDYPSLAFVDEKLLNEENSLFKSSSAEGICKVLVYSRDHSKTLSQFTENEIEFVIDLWKNEFETLAQNNKIAYILLFENKGKIIGVSNPHPHGQLYATDFVPKNIAQMAKSFSEYFTENGSNILQDIVQHELKTNTRVVCENEDWIVIVPYFAQYVYETWLIPKRFFQHLGHLLPNEKTSLALILKDILQKYDKLFGFSLPNITQLFNAPLITTSQYKANHFQFFIKFTPPLREADKLKYLAGFETAGGNIINPLAPEKAAGILRGL